MKKSSIQYLMRLGIACTFIGHGIFAIGVEPKWIVFLTRVGFSTEAAIELMPIIGYMDLVIAVFILFLPIRLILIWATIWAFSTALMRPIVGLPIMAFVERAANWILPMSLLFLQGLPRTVMDLFMVHTKDLRLNKNRDKSIQNI
jgi:hypothetical protein